MTKNDMVIDIAKETGLRQVDIKKIVQMTLDSIIEVLENSPEGPWLTLENTAGMGQHIGARFEELGRICARIASNIDTARNTLDRYKRELNNAIRENQLQERLASNQYEPTRRDQQAVSSMA